MAIVKDGKIVFTKGYGVRDEKKQLPMTGRYGFTDWINHEELYIIVA